MTATSPSVASSGRSLHLVDIENLIQARRPYEPTVRATFASYLAAAFWRPDDDVIVAGHPDIVGQLEPDPLVPCDIHAMEGKDAADRRLLVYMHPKVVAARFATLRIGSGDGIFCGPAKRVRAQGVKVFFVARADHCSRRIWRGGFPVLPFRPPALPNPVT